MIHLQIYKTEYHLKAAWSEITIAEAIQLQAIPIPERLRQLIQTGQDNTTKADLLKTFPDYFGKVIYTLSNIPMEVIDRIHGGDRAGIYSEYLKGLICDLVLMQSANVATFESFTFEGTEFRLPHTAEVFGKGLPFYGVTAVTFTEMADLQLAVADLAAGGLKAAPMLIAVACREVGKPYNETDTIALAKRFEQLPMSVFWQVFFSFRLTLTNWLKLSLQYLTELQDQQAAKLQRLTDPHSARTSLRSHAHNWLARFSRLSNWISIHFMTCCKKIGRTLKRLIVGTTEKEIMEKHLNRLNK